METVKTHENLTDLFDHVIKMNVIVDNQAISLDKDDGKFKNILKVLKEVTEYSHDMPAFGVSIDDLTRKELKSGVWIELEFEKTEYFNEMPFDALLIKVEENVYGFNLIRRYKGKYEGRCFYLSLEKSMNKFYDIFK